MALRTQNVDLRFAAGADTKTDDKNVLFTGFQELKNVRVDKIGAVVPRGGFVRRALFNPDTNNSTAGFDVKSANGITVVAGDGVISTFGADSTSQSGQILRGALKRLLGGQSHAYQPSIAASSTEICMVWVLTNGTSKTGLGIAIINADTEEVVFEAHYAYTAFNRAKVVCLGGTFYVFTALTTIAADVWEVNRTSKVTPLTALTWASKPTFVTSLEFAVCVSGSSIYYASAADGAASVTLYKLSISGTTVTSTSTTAFTLASGSAAGLAITPITGASAVAVAAGSTGSASIMCSFWTSGLVQSGTTRTVAFSGAFSQFAFSEGQFAGEAEYYVTYVASNVYTMTRAVFTNSGQSISSANTNNTLASGFLITEGRKIMVVESPTPPTYGSQAIATPLTAAAAFPASALARTGVNKNVGTSLAPDQLQMDNPLRVGDKIFFGSAFVSGILSINTTNPAAGAFTTPTITPIVSASLLIYNLDEYPQTFLETQNNQTIYVGSATTDVSNYNAPVAPFPELPFGSGQFSLVASGSLSAAVYSYVWALVYRGVTGGEYRVWTPILTANQNANQALSYTFPVTNQYYSSYTVEAYRTEANGSVFYLETTGATGTLSTADTTLITKPVAQISGDALVPGPIGSVRAVTRFKDRLAYVDSDDINTVRFTLPTAAPYGTQASDGLSTVSMDGDCIVALQQMDSTLYVFGKTRLQTIYGDAPGLTGEGGSLSLAQTIIEGTGCSDPRSVILTPKGLMFKSAKGFYMLLRNQECVFVGAGPYADRAVMVTGAICNPDQAEVLFSHADGSVWVYNYDINAWYEWSYGTEWRGLDQSLSKTLLLSDSAIFEYSTSATADGPTGATTAFGQDFTTGWLRMDGIRGFQRIRRMYLNCERLANCTLTIDVYTDYNSTVVQTVTVNTATLSATGNNLEIDIHLAEQKCEAMKFRFRTNQYGLRFSGATMIVGLKSDGAKNTSNNF